MKVPSVRVKPNSDNDAVEYVPLEGDHFVHAIVGKHGELRINSVCVQDDADIEKNKQELTTTPIIVWSANSWRRFNNGAA